jgi:hypothetical protein
MNPSWPFVLLPMEKLLEMAMYTLLTFEDHDCQMRIPDSHLLYNRSLWT